jgi:hypothetical protein
MANGWIIKTFDRTRWDAIFGGNAPATEQKVLDAMLWEEEAYFDPDSEEPRPGPGRDRILASKVGRQAQALARHLARAGFTYEGLDPAQAVKLDEFAATMGAEEALGSELNVDWHSPDFYPMRGVAELLDRTGNSRSWVSRLSFSYFLGRQPPRVPVRYLSLLLTGRRYGTDAEPTRSVHSFYVVFSPAEVAMLKQEVVATVQAPIPWRQQWAQSATEEYLQAPLTKVINGGRWVLMSATIEPRSGNNPNRETIRATTASGTHGRAKMANGHVLDYRHRDL